MAQKPIRVAVLRFTWAPGPVVPDEQPHLTWPDNFFHELFQNNNGWSLRDYWLRASFGLLQLEFDFTISNWWRLGDHTHAELKNNRGGILAACRAVVEEDNGISLAKFDHVVAFVHAPPINAGAIGIGDGASLDQGGTIPFFEHEIGHVLGFQHAFGPFLPPPDPFGSLYNDPYCVMGYTGTQAHQIAPPAQFAQTTILQGASFWRSERRPSAAALYRRFSGSADFVESGWVAHVAAGQRVWIGSLGEVTNTTPVLAVLPIGDERVLTIEYRTSAGDDVGVTPAVVVHSIGAHDVGAGRSEINPPWFEGTIVPVIGRSLSILGVKVEIMTLNTATPSGVEVQMTVESVTDIFVLGQDNQVRTAFRDGAGWHWSLIDGAAFNQGNPITAVRSGDALDIFVLGQDNQVRTAFRDGAGWHWSLIDGAAFNQGNPITAVRSGDALDIFVLGQDNQVRTAFRDGAGWHWSLIDGAAFNQGNPITAVRSGDALDIFVLGQDNQVRTAFRDGAGWHWSLIDGAAFNQGNPITAVRSGDALDIFVLGQDNQVRTAFRDGAGWHWSLIDGAAFNQGNPITAVRSGDALDIFVLGQDNQVRTAFRDGAGWHWSLIDGAAFNQGNPITAVRSGDALDIFVLGQDNQVRTAFRDGAGWHWSLIDGAAFNQGNPITAVRS